MDTKGNANPVMMTALKVLKIDLDDLQPKRLVDFIQK